ncbi:MAG: helix-turn-helix transcriptional regulator [Balneolaceae bacterium]|nr:helix-turn-helix transcriptional regulator [Balneolaceae bacterium]
MAQTKATLFTSSQQQKAEILKAMAHPARLAILELLIQRRECICGAIADTLPLAQSTVSQHLKALKEAHLIKGKTEGIQVCYCLDEEGINQLNDLILPFIEQLNSSQKATCC